jgi:hypothetical protein
VAGEPAPRAPRETLLDFTVELSLMCDVVDKSRSIVFGVRDAPDAPMRWLRLNLPLNQQRVARGATIFAFDVNVLCAEPAVSVGGRLGAGGQFDGDASPFTPASSRPAADPAVAGIHRALISVQSRQRDQQQLTSRRDIWCVLKDHLLYFYDAPGDATPSACVPLELFVVLAITLTGGRRALVLRRSNRQLDSVAQQQNLDFHLLQFANEDAQRLWRNTLRERCLSGLKVFGVPLDEVLERQQRKPPIPKLIEALVGYLDVNALPIQVPRLLLQPPASMALLQCMRDDADHGRSVDLATCRDPHVVGFLLRSYFAELPEPLLGFESYEAWLTAPDTGIGARPRGEWESIICALVANLDLDRFILLKYLASFLLRVCEAVPTVTSAELAKTFAPTLLRARDAETDSPQAQQLALAVTQLLIEQHKKLYTLKDNKKMRLEFKSQRQPPVVDLSAFADPNAPPPPSVPSPGSQPPAVARPAATSGAGAPPSTTQSRGPPPVSPRGGLPQAMRSPRGAPPGPPLSAMPNAAGGAATSTTPRGPSKPKPQLADPSQASPADNAADARKRLATMRAAASTNEAALNDYKTVILFLRKNLSTWLKRRNIDEPPDAGDARAGSMTLDRNAFVTVTFTALDQLIALLLDVAPQHPDAPSKLAMIARTLQFALPEQ